MEKEVVNLKLEEYFGHHIKTAHIIQSNHLKALVLVELQTDYLIVTVSDFTHLPIGDYDVYIDYRLKKTNDPVYDMAKMIELLHIDTEKGIKQLHEKVLEMTGELSDLSKSFKKGTVLSLM
jgi:predicted class III extradiol MEMO1 family dioxygenase